MTYLLAGWTIVTALLHLSGWRDMRRMALRRLRCLVFFEAVYYLALVLYCLSEPGRINGWVVAAAALYHWTGLVIIEFSGSLRKEDPAVRRHFPWIQALDVVELAVLGYVLWCLTPVALAQSEGLARQELERFAPGANVALLVEPKGLPGPESYRVEAGRITGADARGLLYGVYRYLEERGCGFHLSDEHCRPGPTPAGLDIVDGPLVAERAVLNWHNFPSSCSTWGLEHWKTYIRRVARLRFNSLVVHLYGNNPIFPWTHHRVTKPVEVLTTSARGREWGTQNVPDVRRLIGAAGLFDGPEFGGTAAPVPLMQEVFRYAREWGLEVNLAIDVDTESALAKPIVNTLPATARFAGWNERPIPNPEAPEGYAFYRSQVRFLIHTYPTITRLTLWKRVGRTPASQVDPAQLPAAWREEFERLAAGIPAGQREIAAGHFVVNRMARAFRRALDESGRREMPLGVGTWHIAFLELADRFFDPSITFYPLDGTRRLPEAATLGLMREVSRRRRVVSFAWAHHDDETYAGRPYTPFTGFADLLAASGSAGYGVIHWTFRPLDLFFLSLARQTWRTTRNEPLDTTARRLAGGEAEGRYLARWVREAPQFGRETSNFFIDPDHFTDEVVERVVRGIEQRREELAKLPQSRFRRYYQAWEEYARRLYLAGRGLTRARRAYEAGDLQAAARLLDEHRVEQAIEQYAETTRVMGATPGEKGLLLSLNTRFYPYFVMMRQLARVQPVRFSYWPYEPAPLAQGAGRGQFRFDAEGKLWYAFLVAPGSTQGMGLRATSPTELTVGIPLDYWYFQNPKSRGRTGNTPLTNGEYVVELQMGVGYAEVERVRVEPGGSKRFPVRISDGFLHVKLVPVGGEAVLERLVLY